MLSSDAGIRTVFSKSRRIDGLFALKETGRDRRFLCCARRGESGPYELSREIFLALTVQTGLSARHSVVQDFAAQRTA